MADGSISFAEGLGCKAQDSIEMRRKQMLISQNPKSSIQLGQELRKLSISTRLRLKVLHGIHIELFFQEGVIMAAEKPANHVQVGLGEFSPNSPRKISPSRKLQQVFKQALICEAEERATPLLKQVQVDKPNPKILYNAEGNPYVEGDPNLGYGVEDVKPRRHWLSESETHTGNSKQMSDLEQAARVPILHQGDSSKSGPSILREQIPINLAVHSSESDSEGELLEVLAAVVGSSQGISQTPLNMEVMDSSAGSIPSSVPRDGIGLKLNQTLSPKPPDPQGPEVRDKASEGDLKGNFQKVLSKSAQRRMKKIPKEQSLSSISRGRN
ncbi:hypothetical protein RHSIM_Rhsim12G0101200 [Rhododendron simsii]|uniref:Uncharacterized protein n=1 Tax=Rhododendron simsii TaxID=118357 RepID=A0A834G6P6_RHOSS|nr:hypothetical protein RHSIM_Rhsim12G0101200 [Rhododendron simsii]